VSREKRTQNGNGKIGSLLVKQDEPINILN